MTFRTASIAAALALCLPGTALAKEGGNGHAQHGNQAHQGHGPNHAKPRPGGRSRAKACPPGLAKQNPGCLPPGQWRKGDRLPDSWIGQYVAYAALPDFYRSRHPVSARHRYVYRDNRVFVVDAVSRVVLDVILR